MAKVSVTSALSGFLSNSVLSKSCPRELGIRGTSESNITVTRKRKLLPVTECCNASMMLDA